MELVCCGKDAQVMLDKVTLRKCSVVAVDGACLHMKSCDSIWSMVGVAGFGSGTLVTAVNYSAKRCTQGLVVNGDAKFCGTSCMFVGELEPSVRSQVSVTGGAHAEMSKCAVRNSWGHGVLVQGQGSTLQADELTITHVQLNGVCVLDGARATLSECTVTACRQAPGLHVSGKGSDLQANQCTVAHHRWSCVCVQTSATATLRQCKLTDSYEGYGLEVQGAGTRVEARACEFERNCAASVSAAKHCEVDLWGCINKGVMGVAAARKQSGAKLRYHATCPDAQVVN